MGLTSWHGNVQQPAASQRAERSTLLAIDRQAQVHRELPSSSSPSTSFSNLLCVPHHVLNGTLHGSRQLSHWALPSWITGAVGHIASGREKSRLAATIINKIAIPELQ